MTIGKDKLKQAYQRVFLPKFPKKELLQNLDVLFSGQQWPRSYESLLAMDGMPSWKGEPFWLFRFSLQPVIILPCSAEGSDHWGSAPAPVPKHLEPYCNDEKENQDKRDHSMQSDLWDSFSEYRKDPILLSGDPPLFHLWKKLHKAPALKRKERLLNKRAKLRKLETIRKQERDESGNMRYFSVCT